jgi:hypothetical protein
VKPAIVSTVFFFAGLSFIYVYLFTYFLLLCWVWVCCGIYKMSYNVSNISYLNSPLPLLSFIPSFPQFLETFEQYLFSFTYICAHFYTIFTLLPPFPTTSPLPLVWTPISPGQDLFYPPLILKKRKEKIFKMSVLLI